VITRARQRTFRGSDGRWGAKLALFSRRGRAWRFQGSWLQPAVCADEAAAVAGLNELVLAAGVGGAVVLIRRASR